MWKVLLFSIAITVSPELPSLSDTAIAARCFICSPLLSFFASCVKKMDSLTNECFYASSNYARNQYIWMVPLICIGWRTFETFEIKPEPRVTRLFLKCKEEKVQILEIRR